MNNKIKEALMNSMLTIDLENYQLRYIKKLLEELDYNGLEEFLDYILETCTINEISLDRFFYTIVRNGRHGKKIFDILLKNDLDVNLPIGTIEPKFLLQYAITKCYSWIVSSLLECSADINVEDSFGNSCISPLCGANYAETFNYTTTCNIIFIHLIRLSGLGLNISNKVRECCIRLYPLYKIAIKRDKKKCTKLNVAWKQCAAELQSMKLIKLNYRTSLYSILQKHPREICKYIKNKILIENVNEYEKFYFYGKLVKQKFEKALIMSKLHQSGKTILTKIINTDIPDLCLDLIFEHLENEDILNLEISAATNEL